MRTTLNQSKIKTIGIVAYGKDYTADVSVQSLEFYWLDNLLNPAMARECMSSGHTKWGY